MGDQLTIRLQVNGNSVEAHVPAGTLLVDFLRGHLRLTGTKVGCGVGVCGACTVLLDEKPVSSCLLPLCLCEGLSVWSVEGLAGRIAAADESGHVRELLAVQRAFVAHEGLQCGICTAGQVVSAFALLQENPQPTPAEIVEAMAGNLCRCTGYHSILRSIRAAAGEEVADDALV